MNYFFLVVPLNMIEDFIAILPTFFRPWGVVLLQRFVLQQNIVMRLLALLPAAVLCRAGLFKRVFYKCKDGVNNNILGYSNTFTNRMRWIQPTQQAQI